MIRQHVMHKGQGFAEVQQMIAVVLRANGRINEPARPTCVGKGEQTCTPPWPWRWPSWALASVGLT